MPQRALDGAEAHPDEPASAAQPGALVWALLLATAAWLAATAWMRPLALPDEGRYAGVAWEMLRSGQWLEPTLNGMPFLHKPPLWYWLSAASMSLFGVHPWAARLPSWLGALLAAGAMFWLQRRWAGEGGARRSLQVLATLPLFYGGAQFANHDMLVAGCISAAIVLAADAVRQRELGMTGRAAALGAFLFAALGVLTKGLIGAVLPALVFALWAAASGRSRALRLLAWWPGWALFALVATPWFVAMQARHPGFFEYFFVVQQLRRYVGSDFNNPHGWWFLVAALLGLSLPWSPWLLAIRDRRFFGAAHGGDLRLLMAIWLVTVLLFFSLPRSKLVGYVLPALVPLAFLAGEGIAFARRAAGPRATSALAGVSPASSRWRGWRPWVRNRSAARWARCAAASPGAIAC